ncbi:MAG TPA: DHA2 family efflux MFS transporter permease subunit [Chloroflexota bacterium]|nr:DHA2 family efflux MFS transporter permease subunit [Chloroflexota bacterium]
MMQQNVGGTEQGAGNRWLILLTVSMGAIMGALDSSIVSVALPNITSAFGTNFEGIKWVSIGYMLANGSLMPMMGRIGDLFGRKRSYLFGFATFVLGSALCGLSWSVPSLVAFRIIQAIGASNMYPIALAIVNHAFPPTQRGQALGLYSSSSVAAVIFGPIVGGLLVDSLGWRSIFYVNLPIGVLAIFMALLLIPEDSKRESGEFDFVGALVLAASMSFLLYGINQGSDLGWGSLPIFGCFWLAAFLLFTFGVIESLSARPLIPLSLFRGRNFTTVLGTNFMLLAAETGATFLIPFFMGSVMGYGPTQRGLLMLPTAFGIMCTAPFGGKLADQLGPKFPAFVGLAIAGAGTWGFASFNASSSVSDMIKPMYVAGLGVGLVMAPMTSAALSSVPTEMSGVASGILSLTRNIGGPLGLSVMTVVDSHRMAFHSASLAQSVNVLSPTAVMTMDSLQARLSSMGLLPDQAKVAAIGILQGTIATDAFVMAFQDTFMIAAAIMWVGLLPVLLLQNERQASRTRERGMAAV